MNSPLRTFGGGNSIGNLTPFRTQRKQYETIIMNNFYIYYILPVLLCNALLEAFFFV